MKKLSVFLALLSIPAVASAQTDERRARWEAAQADQRRFLHNQFVRAGFEPIEAARAARREVRRLVLDQPYGGFPVPGIELERHPDGRVTLRMQYAQWSTDPVEIDPSAWSSLTARDTAVFAPPEYVPPPPPTTPPPPPPPPPPACHAWHAWLEADSDRVTSWSGCNDLHQEARAYVTAMVELAMATRPACGRQPSLLYAFVTCFELRDALDDPELQRTYAVLRREFFDAAEGLGAAWKTVDAPGPVPGDAERVEARAAVDRLAESVAYRRERLRRLEALAAGARDASTPDRAKMQRAIESWSRFVQGQEAGLATLRERLERAGTRADGEAAPVAIAVGARPEGYARPADYEDPALNAHMMRWRGEWEELGAAAGRQFGEAWRAAQAARGEAVGSPLWSTAREAVTEAVRARERQQGALWALMRHRTSVQRSLSAPDRDRLTREIEERELAFSRTEYSLRSLVSNFLR